MSPDWVALPAQIWPFFIRAVTLILDPKLYPVQSQDTSPAEFRKECRRVSAQTCVLV